MDINTTHLLLHCNVITVCIRCTRLGSALAHDSGINYERVRVSVYGGSSQGTGFGSGWGIEHWDSLRNEHSFSALDRELNAVQREVIPMRCWHLNCSVIGQWNRACSLV